MKEKENQVTVSIGAVQGHLAWEDSKKMYLCKCGRCKREDIWSIDEMLAHNIKCRDETSAPDTRILCLDRKETAPGTIVNGRHGATKCIAYRGAQDVDVLFLENGAVAYHKEWKKFLEGGIKNPEGDGWKHIGETRTMNCGMECKITAWRKAHDIDVEFADGYSLKGVSYSTYKSGALNNPNVKRTTGKHRIGETGVNCQGLKMTIVDYASADDIAVQFEDGVTVKHRKYTSFQKGGISHPTHYSDSKIGERSLAINGLWMEIIDYKKSNDITIRFEDGVERKTIYAEFKKGCVKHPQLWVKKKGTYKGFETLYQWNEEGRTIYKCKCTKCGFESLLTPQEMIKHEKECKYYGQKVH